MRQPPSLFDMLPQLPWRQIRVGKCSQLLFTPKFRRLWTPSEAVDVVERTAGLVGTCKGIYNGKPHDRWGMLDVAVWNLEWMNEKTWENLGFRV